MKVLALIPARGGSKGIPGKNIAPFLGRPLISYAIEVAIASRAFDRIIVSTDDKGIAHIAQAWGAEVPFTRPKDLAKDETKDLPVLDHALRWLKDHESYSADAVVILRPTTPLRTTQDIRRVIEKLGTSTCDSVRTACIAEHHPYRMVRLEGETASSLLPEEAPMIPYRRQELPPVYRWNSLADAIWTKTILDSSSMFGQIIKVVVTPRERSIDIDEMFDLFLAECVAKSGNWRD